MMIALVNTLQVPSREALRIMLYTLSTSASSDVENTIRYILSKSTERGHTSRSKRLEVRLPESEKIPFLNKAKELGLTEKEAIRLAIVHLEKSIRSGRLTKLSGSRMLSQGECWDAWSEARPESSGALKNLKKAAHEAWNEAAEIGIKQAEDLYEKRGEQIDALIYGGGYIPTDDEGEICLDYVDALIRMSNEEQEAFEFDEFVTYLSNLSENCS